eukprot:g6340.t1
MPSKRTKTPKNKSRKKSKSDNDTVSNTTRTTTVDADGNEEERVETVKYSRHTANAYDFQWYVRVLARMLFCTWIAFSAYTRIVSKKRMDRDTDHIVPYLMISHSVLFVIDEIMCYLEMIGIIILGIGYEKMGATILLLFYLFPRLFLVTQRYLVCDYKDPTICPGYLRRDEAKDELEILHILTIIGAVLYMWQGNYYEKIHEIKIINKLKHHKKVAVAKFVEPTHPSEERVVLKRVNKRSKHIPYNKIPKSKPHERDDLKQLPGVTEWVEKKLFAAGLFTFHQIMHLEEELEHVVMDVIEHVKEKEHKWADEASRLFHELSEDVIAEKNELSRIAQNVVDIPLHIIGHAFFFERDDLQRIKGIGPFIENKLHAIEIYTWRQIANMTPEIEKQVNIAIEYFPGRATRDHWADQGKIFADEKDHIMPEIEVEKELERDCHQFA